MSYDIHLCDPVTHEALQTDVPHDMRGGTYAMGGTTGLWLNVTYNYGKQTDNCRLHRCGKVFRSHFYFIFIINGNFFKHLLYVTGFFSDTKHMMNHHREYPGSFDRL